MTLVSCHTLPNRSPEESAYDKTIDCEDNVAFFLENGGYRFFGTQWGGGSPTLGFQRQTGISSCSFAGSILPEGPLLNKQVSKPGIEVRT